MKVPKELSDLLKEKYKRIIPIFNTLALPPRIQMRTDIPQEDVAAGGAAFFAYQLGKNNGRIWIDANWYSKNKNDLHEIHWAISEELCHYFHHVINFPIWDEIADIEERQNKGVWKHGNYRILELKNLAELVARVGGMYGGIPPPDFERMLEVWNKVVIAKLKELNFKGPDELDNYCKSDHFFGRVLYHLSNRVWGCHIGDRIARQSEGSCPAKT